MSQAEPGIATEEAMRVASFRAALRQFLRQTELVANANGLTPQRYLLLLMIKGAPGGREQSTITELTVRLGLAKNTVTELVGRAEQAGLVERERSSADGRVAHLRLTAEGERRLARAFRGLSAQRRALRRALTDLDR